MKQDKVTTCRRCGAAMRSPQTFYCECAECFDRREHLKRCNECGDQQHYPGPRPIDAAAREIEESDDVAGVLAALARFEAQETQP